METKLPILVEIRGKYRGISLKPFILFVLLTGFLAWVYYPVGVYSMNGDTWSYANMITALMEKYDFSNDLYMRDKSLFGYFTIGLFEIPFVRLLKEYESFLLFSHATLFFIGICLFYMVCFLITGSNVISFFSAILYTLSVIIFSSTSSAFSLVPVTSVRGEVIASVYYYMLLLGFLSLKITPRRLYCLVFLTTGMAWIHALTFLGLGVALIITGCLSLLLSKQYNIKQKLIVMLLSSLILLVSFAPYMQLFLIPSFFSSSRDILAPEYVEELGIGFTVYMFNPMLFATYLIDIFGIGGKAIAGYLFLFSLSTITLFFLKKDGNIRFLGGIMIICFFFNLFLQEIDCILKYKMNLWLLARNSKWLYLNLFLLFLAAYPGLREVVKKHSKNNQYSIILLNATICFLLFALFTPHIIKTFKYGFMTHKLAEKTGICNILNDGKKILLLTSIVSRYCPDETSLSLSRVNKDAEEVSAFMRTLPVKLTFIGPNWLRYKTGRNMSFTRHDGRLYLFRRDTRYLKWKEKSEVYEKLFNGFLANKLTPSEFNDGMRFIGGSFFFLEKFRMESVGNEKGIIKFTKLNVNLEGFPVIFENESFAIIDLREVYKTAA